MILDATTKTIEVVLEGAVTSNQLDVTSGYADSYPGGGFLPGEQDTSTNGATPVTAVSAPVANVQRMVNEVRVYNKDTVSHTITIQLNDNGTRRVLQKEPAAAGAVVLYSPSGGTLTTRAPLDFVELESGSVPVKISAMADLNLAGPPSASAKISAETGGTTNLGIQLDTLWKLFVDWLGYIAANPLDGNPGKDIAFTAGNALSGNNNGGNITVTAGTATGAGTPGFAAFLSGNIASGAVGSGEVDVGSGTTDSGTSGQVFLFSGDSANGNSGDTNVTSGNAPNGTSGMTNLGSAPGKSSGNVGFATGNASAGNSGNISLVSGNATGGNSGTITLQIGTATGTKGNLLIVNIPTSSAGLPANAIWCDTGAANVLKRV